MKKIFKDSLIYLSIIIALALAFYISLKLFYESHLCHGDIVLFVRGSSGIFGPDEQKVYFVVYPHFFRPAEGICAFPDGGAPITIHESLDLYELDLQTKHVILCSRLEGFSKKLFINGEVEFLYKGKNKAYGVAGGQDRNNLSLRRLCLEIDIVSKTIRQLSEEDYRKITSQIEHIRGSYDFDSQGRYMRFHYGKEGYGMPISYKLYDKKNNSEVLLEGTDWLPYHYN